ncbi:glycosyltransferase family 2 protein [bacterium]|nr:glycosyltransferase family 2 protein [bacterium]
MLISIVVPIYNEEAIILELHRRLTAVMQGMPDDYELVFVNDGSRDGSRQLLKGVVSSDPRSRLIDLSRNFGHQIAITAGLDHARGDAVVIIDADLQDPPEVIPRLVEKWREGFDVVYAVRAKRQGESLFKRVTAAGFYRLIARITNVEIPIDTGDFRLMNRRAVESLKRVREKNRFVRGLVAWIGFRQVGVEFVREERFAGETKYPLKKMLKFAFDGITSFSFLPLQLATYLGFLVSGVSFLGILYVIYLRVFAHATIVGWASLMAVLLFLGGVQLITIGIIGEYIGRIYEEVRGRPLYLTQEVLGFDERDEGA